jgi:hypothetical protein
MGQQSLFKDYVIKHEEEKNSIQLSKSKLSLQYIFDIVYLVP